MTENYEIIDYEDRYQPVFKSMNVEWLDRYHLTESHDLQILDAPRDTIINRGGHIFLARLGAEIIGSAALMKEHDGEYELAKMAVIPAFRGHGISKGLMQACLDKARQLQAKKITLFSNHQLTTALALYERFGFKHVPVENSPFTTADVKMELAINEG